MRVVEIAASWPAEVFIQRHFDAVTQAGLDVICAAKMAAGSLEEKATILPARPRNGVIALPDFDRMNWMHKLQILARTTGTKLLYRNDLPLRRRAWLAEISRLKPDLIHYHNAQLAASLSWIAVELNLPYTVSVRGADVQEIPLRDPEQARSIRAALEGAAGIQAVCKAFAGLPLLAGLGVATIYTTISLPEAPGDYPERCDVLRLVSVGRLHWRKGYPDLLAAVRGLIDSGMKAKLTIYGSGQERDRLEYWIDRLELDEQVRLAGKTTPEEIRQAMMNAHAYIQSSYAEGLSNALAEAMAYGCPVFATDVAGTAEAIEEGVTGRLLPVGEPEKWVHLLRSIGERNEMMRLREAAYIRAREMFSPEKHTHDFRRFFEGSISKSSETGVRVANYFFESIKQSEAKDAAQSKPRLVIRGEWRWQNGIDLLLREFFRQGVFERFDIRLDGAGPQEDELRYLADKFGLGQLAFLSDASLAPVAQEDEVLAFCKPVGHFSWQLYLGGRLFGTESIAQVAERLSGKTVAKESLT